jgi:ADP-ribosyltransferase exoenzyme
MAGMGSSWGTAEEMLHPRDSHGRFRSSWKMSGAAVKRTMALLDAFNGRTFDSDEHVGNYLSGVRQSRHGDGSTEISKLVRNYASINANLRKKGPETPDVAAIDAAMVESPDDLILHRVVGPEAFGLKADNIANLEEYTGKLVADLGYSSTNAGTPLPHQAGQIQLTIATPKGTKIGLPGKGTREVFLEREQPLRITKVTPDGQGGFYVMAVAMPKGSAGNLRAKKLGSRAPKVTEPGSQVAPPPPPPPAGTGLINEGDILPKKKTGRPAGPPPPPRNDGHVVQSIGGKPAGDQPASGEPPRQPRTNRKATTAEDIAKREQAKAAIKQDAATRRQADIQAVADKIGVAAPEDTDANALARSLIGLAHSEETKLAANRRFPLSHWSEQLRQAADKPYNAGSKKFLLAYAEHLDKKPGRKTAVAKKAPAAKAAKPAVAKAAVPGPASATYTPVSHQAFTDAHFDVQTGTGERWYEHLTSDTKPNQPIQVRNLRMRDGMEDIVIEHAVIHREGGVAYLVQTDANADPIHTRMVVSQLREMHDRLPAATAARAQKGYMWLSTTSPNDAFWQKRFNDPNHVTLAAAGSGTTMVFGQSKKSQPLDLEGTLRHEFGHNVDGLHGYASQGPQWHDSAAKDVGAVKVDLLAARPIGGHQITLTSEAGRAFPDGVTTYGKSSAREDWAESLRLYMAGWLGTGKINGGPIGRVYFRDLFPNRAKILDRMFPDLARQQASQKQTQ